MTSPLIILAIRTPPHELPGSSPAAGPAGVPSVLMRLLHDRADAVRRLLPAARSPPCWRASAMAELTGSWHGARHGVHADRAAPSGCAVAGDRRYCLRSCTCSAPTCRPSQRRFGCRFTACSRTSTGLTGSDMGFAAARAAYWAQRCGRGDVADRRPGVSTGWRCALLAWFVPLVRRTLQTGASSAATRLADAGRRDRVVLAWRVWPAATSRSAREGVTTVIAESRAPLAETVIWRPDRHRRLAARLRRRRAQRLRACADRAGRRSVGSSW